MTFIPFDKEFVKNKKDLFWNDSYKASGVSLN